MRSLQPGDQTPPRHFARLPSGACRRRQMGEVAPLPASLYLASAAPPPSSRRQIGAAQSIEARPLCVICGPGHSRARVEAADRTRRAFGLEETGRAIKNRASPARWGLRRERSPSRTSGGSTIACAAPRRAGNRAHSASFAAYRIQLAHAMKAWQRPAGLRDGF